MIKKVTLIFFLDFPRIFLEPLHGILHQCHFEVEPFDLPGKNWTEFFFENLQFLQPLGFRRLSERGPFLFKNIERHLFKNQITIASRLARNSAIIWREMRHDAYSSIN